MEGAAEYVELLETSMWPLLGINPVAHTAAAAWVHFRQYAITGEAGLVPEIKRRISDLAKLLKSCAPSACHRSLQGQTDRLVSVRPTL